MLTKIDYASDTWNPITGCTPVSAGCENCYAKRMATRLRGRHGYPEDNPFKVTLHPDRLEQPLRWRKPRRVFVCSMGDLFHEDVSESVINKVLHVISVSFQHTFLALTKRPQRMKQIIEDYFAWESPEGQSGISPPRNFWLGVTAENQAAADERIPILLETPATVRFLSVEPMLESINIFQSCDVVLNDGSGTIPAVEGINKSLHWIICGGESGPGARPMHPDWVRSLRNQCQAAGVPFFFKQWGEWYPDKKRLFNADSMLFGDTAVHRIGKRAAGRLLDGREWNEYPGNNGD